MGLYAHHHIRRLNADNQVIISHVLNHANLVQGAFHKPLGCHTAVLFNQGLFQGSAVYSNTNRNLLLFGFFHHCQNPLPASDISRINSDLICAVLHSLNSQTVIKVYIRHKRNVNLLLNLCQTFGRFHGRNRYSDNIASCPL